MGIRETLEMNWSIHESVYKDCMWNAVRQLYRLTTAPSMPMSPLPIPSFPEIDDLVANYPELDVHYDLGSAGPAWGPMPESVLDP